MKIHAGTNGVSTIAIPKLSCGLDQMNWQEVVKLLRDIFAYADVQIVVYTLEENGVHALSRQNFHVTLKPNVELKRQRPDKVPLHLKEKLEKLLTQLKDADIFRERGDDDQMGSLFMNPIILMLKNDYMKVVIDARYLISVTDLTNYSWPLEPMHMIMTRVNGKVFSLSDLSCAYHEVPLSPETQKLTSFIIGGKQYTYTRGF